MRHRMLPQVWMLFSLLAPTPALANTIDRLTAVVETELVLASEERIEAELAVLDASPTPFWSPDRAAPRQRLVEAAVVRVAAQGLALYQPDDDEVVERRETVRAQFQRRREWVAFLSSHGLTEAGLDEVLRRRMVVERFLTRNLDTPLDQVVAWQQAADRLVLQLQSLSLIHI